MSETEHEHDTEGTGDATTGADVPEDAATHTTGTGSAREPEGEAEEEKGPFGGLTPGEASRLRWERARAAAADPDHADPRRKMAQSLQSKAEKGDVRAFELWQRLTTELEEERLARDGADGARAWEQVTPAQRRLLLDLLSGEAVVLTGEDAERWKAMQEGQEEVAQATR